MTGFRVKKRTAIIKFEGTEYDGAEIECLFDIPLKKLFEIQRLAEAGKAEESFRQFGDEILTAWNIEQDDGNPIPATGEGLLNQPPQFANLILSKWLAAMTEPPAPFASQPNSGGTSAVTEQA
jgi:hypothetical protein